MKPLSRDTVKREFCKERDKRKEKDDKMSSDSSDSGNDTKGYKLRSRKKFPTWKQKMISNASSKGLDKYLLNDENVKTQDELDAQETSYINETDDGQRRIKKSQLNKWTRERREVWQQRP